MQKSSYYKYFRFFSLNIILHSNFFFANTAAHLECVFHLVWLHAHATDPFTNKRTRVYQSNVIQNSVVFVLQCVILIVTSLVII